MPAGGQPGSCVPHKQVSSGPVAGSPVRSGGVFWHVGNTLYTAPRVGGGAVRIE